MMMDLVYVSYNSQKWIEGCFASLLKSDCDLSQITVYVVDNASSDDSLQQLENAKRMCSDALRGFHIISNRENAGFGKANNIGFAEGSSEIVCFLNMDTVLCKDTLSQLQKQIAQSGQQTGAWELRQFPYEHPKIYDALTHETEWCSGAAFAIRRELYRKIGGFDETIFMYAEDVDLSWRLRIGGYKIQYCPTAVIYHYSYQNAGEVKPNQYINCIVNSLLLRYRFGSWADVLEGHLRLLRQFFKAEVFEHFRKILLRRYLQHFRQSFAFLRSRKNYRNKNFKPAFNGFDYSQRREGAFYENRFPSSNELVSIIVRTCGRPDVLRETLLSLRHQTYQNIEIVIVEDGQDISRNMLETEFSDLNILYAASGGKVGRSKAGNIGMELAHGKYLNFLDDDDLFYADHVEVLLSALENRKERAAYTFAYETPIEVYSKTPYSYKLHGYHQVHKQSFNKFLLCHHNYIPIQCIMFEKSLFEEHGGLDETLDALEDWDLWVRYSLHTDFVCVEKTTSIYRVPYDQGKDVKRQKALDDTLRVVREKHKDYVQTFRVYDVAEAYESILSATSLKQKLRTYLDFRKYIGRDR